MATRTYSSKSNAARAARSLATKLGESFTVEVTEDYHVQVTFAGRVADLSTETLAVIGDRAVLVGLEDEPEPRARTVRPYAEWDRSDCEGPVALVHDVCECFYRRAEGDAYDVSAVIGECVREGVSKNTAYTQHRAWRVKKGLPPSTRGRGSQ